MKKISVCVPAYNRVDTVIQLINSFEKQDYRNKELVISDDSTNNEVMDTILKLNKPYIIYKKNKKNIGFTENLKQALLMAKGDYILILGDDDVLLKKNTLSLYAHAFSKSEDIYYVYANQVQFSENLDIQYEINMFDKNKLHKKSIESFKNLWLTSIFIGGLGLRNDRRIINKYYPTKKILHPQVELCGNMLLNYSAYTIKENLIGFRSRETQFIFRALKNKKERQSGEHQNIELFKIFRRISKKNGIQIDEKFIFDRLLKDSLIMFPKEKMILGKQMLKKNYDSFVQISNHAKRSKKLFLVFLISHFVPSWFIFMMRNITFKIVYFKNKKSFDNYKRDLMIAINE